MPRYDSSFAPPALLSMSSGPLLYASSLRRFLQISAPPPRPVLPHRTFRAHRYLLCGYPCPRTVPVEWFHQRSTGHWHRRPFRQGLRHRYHTAIPCWVPNRCRVALHNSYLIMRPARVSQLCPFRCCDTSNTCHRHESLDDNELGNNDLGCYVGTYDSGMVASPGIVLTTYTDATNICQVNITICYEHGHHHRAYLASLSLHSDMASQCAQQVSIARVKVANTITCRNGHQALVILPTRMQGFMR